MIARPKAQHWSIRDKGPKPVAFLKAQHFGPRRKKKKQQLVKTVSLFILSESCNLKPRHRHHRRRRRHQNLLNTRQMALRGVWQLKKLIVSYSDWGGSSRGIRAFMESHLPTFKAENPHLKVETELIRGQHPHLKAFYKNNNERVVCVRNMTPDEVLLHATRLRNALGRKVVKLKTRHVTKHPSVQGTWTTALKFEEA
ncbi:54S ribosomal protein L51, mitochondrial [Linum perenne]